MKLRIATALASLFEQPRVTDSAIVLSDEQSGALSGCTLIARNQPGMAGSGAAGGGASAAPDADRIPPASIPTTTNRIAFFICILLNEPRTTRLVPT